jgi:hypothetical protein
MPPSRAEIIRDVAGETRRYPAPERYFNSVLTAYARVQYFLKGEIDETTIVGE